MFNSRGRQGMALLALVILLTPAPAVAAPPAERHFRIEARSFEYAPAVLSVNPGDRVTIDVVAQDVMHGLYVDGYGLSVTAEPGRTARLTFTADRPGAFRLRCSVTCGPLHPFMLGKLTVGINWLWWRAVALAALIAFAVVFDHRLRQDPSSLSLPGPGSPR